MKLAIRHTILLLVVGSLFSSSERNNFCEVFGAVYVTTSKNQSDYTVYVEDSEAFADLLIFKEENELFADEEGKWFFIKDQTFADFTVYITKNKREADFTIFYTETESFAGCSN